MTYLDPVRDALARELPGLHPELLDLYTLLTLTKGLEVTPEDVHDAWGLWTRKYRKTSPWLVPYADLPSEEQDKDEQYVQAIKTVAAALQSGAPAADGPQ
jgi:hypothetical protein